MSSNGFHSSTRLHNLRSLFSIFSSDLAIDLGTANTLVYARGQGHRGQRALHRGHQQEHRRSRGRGQRSQRDAGPHARQHRGHQAHERRRHRRLQSHREDAQLLHPEGAQPQDAGASAHRDRRAFGDHAGGKARGAWTPPIAPRPAKCTWWSRPWWRPSAPDFPLRNPAATWWSISAAEPPTSR